MKKVFAFLAIAATLCVVACKKTDEPKKEDPKPTETTITANDVTVEVGKTASIGATTNSSAAISYVADNSGVYTVDNAGVVTGVKAGNGNITLKVAAVEGKFTAAEKTIKVTVTGGEEPGPGPEPAASITIDGKFEDWAALKDGTYSKTYGDDDATHPALTHCKVYAVPDYVYVYIEWDTDAITYEADVEHVPFHCYINTDGDESTGGFASQFSDACTDVLFEGFLYDGGVMGSYDPGAYAWAGEPNGDGWSWDDLGAEGGLCEGAGVDGKYEFLIKRSVFAAMGYPIADIFSIGFDIQQSWDSVGILPNAAPSEDNPSGVVNSLEVVTQK